MMYWITMIQNQKLKICQSSGTTKMMKLPHLSNMEEATGAHQEGPNQEIHLLVTIRPLRGPHKM